MNKKEETSKYVNDIFNCVFNCLIICRKVIDTINYYEVSNIYKELNYNLKHILHDIVSAFLSEGIIAASDLLINEASPINYIKIKKKINNERLVKKSKVKLIQKIDKLHSEYKNSKHYPILTDKNSGMAFLRDKVFAHTDNTGLFHVVQKEVIDNLEKVIIDLYELHRELLIELSDKDEAKTMIAKNLLKANEYYNQSKNKASLLKKIIQSENKLL